MNGRQINAIHMGYRQTGAVYTRRFGSVQIHPDRPPISVRARIGSNSSPVQFTSITTNRQVHVLQNVNIKQLYPSVNIIPAVSIVTFPSWVCFSWYHTVMSCYSFCGIVSNEIPACTENKAD